MKLGDKRDGDDAVRIDLRHDGGYGSTTIGAPDTHGLSAG
jgi:hypothetical protein